METPHFNIRMIGRWVGGWEEEGGGDLFLKKKRDMHLSETPTLWYFNRKSTLNTAYENGAYSYGQSYMELAIYQPFD